MGEIIFLTGTDTGVGKTYIGTLLLGKLLAGGFDAVALKPVESGCAESPEGKLVPADGMKYYDLLKDPSLMPEDICFYRYRESVSPNIAARLSGVIPAPENITRRIRKESEKRDIVLVEGAGGIMVEILDGYAFLDLLSELDMNVMIVAPNRLGILNQVALTVKTLRDAAIRIAGILLNDLSATRDGASEHNLDELQRIYGDSIVGHISYNSTVLPDDIIEKLLR